MNAGILNRASGVARSIRALTLKQALAAMMGPGLLVLAIDSAIGHFAGKGLSHLGQLIPIAFGVLGGVALSFLGLQPFRLRAVRLCARIVGAIGVAVGLLGTLFHFIPLIKDLMDEPLSLSAIQGALSVAPPVFAPMAFAGVGALLWFLGSPRLYLGLRDAETVASASEDEDVDQLLEEAEALRRKRRYG
jgi:hypothetical protein